MWLSLFLHCYDGVVVHVGQLTLVCQDSPRHQEHLIDDVLAQVHLTANVCIKPVSTLLSARDREFVSIQAPGCADRSELAP